MISAADNMGQTSQLHRRNSGGSYFNGLIDEVRVSNPVVYTSNFTAQVHLRQQEAPEAYGSLMALEHKRPSTNGNNGTLQAKVSLIPASARSTTPAPLVRFASQ